MTKTSNSNEKEMVHEFLKMEIVSDRYADTIQRILSDLSFTEKIITRGNTMDYSEHIARSIVLGEFRGYKKNTDIFERFPSKIEWVWALADNDDIHKMKYINYCYWNELSSFTGSPVVAGQAVLDGKIVYDVENDGFYEAYEHIKAGGAFPPIILLTNRDETVYYILEGHKRMTAYGMDVSLFKDVRVLLGICDDNELADWYGMME